MLLLSLTSGLAVVVVIDKKITKNTGILSANVIIIIGGMGVFSELLN